MKRTITTTLMLFLMIFAVSAQKTELLKGKWKFKNVADKDKLDPTILSQANTMFSKMEMEFVPGGKYSYNPLGNNPLSLFSGTWTLNKEQTKVSVTVSNQSAPDNKQTSDWEIKGLTENELKLNMGKAVIVFGRPPVELTGLQKTCNIDFFSKLASGVRNKDIDAVKSAAKNSLSITGYTESEKKTNRWGDNYTELKSNEKFGLMEVPFKISKYENGEISVYRNMTQEEINFTREALKKTEAANKGWKFKGNDGLWEYWENGEVVFWFSAKETGSGSDTNIYTKKQIRMN